MIQSDRYYTAREAAEILKVHPRTLLNWIEFGRISACRPGHKYLILGQDILAKLESSKVRVY